MATRSAGAQSLRRLARPSATSSRLCINPKFRQAAKRDLYQTSHTSSSTHASWTRPSAAVLVAAATVALVYASNVREAHAEAAPTEPPEVVFEKTKKKKGATKEQNRDLISSQHLQVKKSWENPGVYAFGSNSGKVVAPDSNDTYIKTARRIAWFDDKLLRDIKLDRQFGAAVLENGDLVQWGTAYAEDISEPTLTLRGKNLKQIAISRDRIVALSSAGSVYSIPVSRSEQESGPKPAESSWIPFWSSRSPIAYRSLTPKNLPYSETITAISGGLEHVLLLTSAGRVFSAASGSEDFPQRGQLGIPGLTWTNRPLGAYDQPHEITTLRGFDIAAVATGDYHSLVLDRQGRVFSFGDNSSGQLGFDFNSEAPFVDAPSLLPISDLYRGTSTVQRVTSISAGGANSFFTVDATRVASPADDPADTSKLGRITADTYSCGTGIRGTLGTGRWTHIQGTPVKIPSLSGLFEYDEIKRSIVPIRLASISAGSTHAAAIMSNITYLDASERSSADTTNWGADVLWWGGNEFYQLGTGKRNNVANPTYIRPLDMGAEVEMGRREEHRFHITPRHTVSLKGRRVSLEQRIECGRSVSAVYSAV